MENEEMAKMAELIDRVPFEDDPVDGPNVEKSLGYDQQRGPA